MVGHTLKVLAFVLVVLAVLDSTGLLTGPQPLVDLFVLAMAACFLLALVADWRR